MEPPAISMKPYEVVELPIKRKQERVYLDPALASRLEPFQLKSGLLASTLTAKLDARDNKFSLKVRHTRQRWLIPLLFSPALLYCSPYTALIPAINLSAKKNLAIY